MEYKERFGNNDIGIIVSSNDRIILDGLIDKYENYFIDNPPYYSFKINFIIKSDLENITGYKDNENGDSTFNIICGDKNEMFVYLPYYDNYKEDFVKRILTTSFVKKFQENKYAIIHGACITKNNKGLMIVGDSGSGKTTLLMKFLKEGYTYIANDRLAVKKDCNQIISCGIPFSMGIRSKDAKDIDTIGCKYIESIDKIFIENKDVPQKSNVSMINKTNVDSIIYCDYDTSFSGIRSKPVENNIEKISNNLLSKESIPKQKWYLHDIIKSKEFYPEFLNEMYGFEFLQGNNSDLFIVKDIEEKLAKVRSRGR